jgi:hypothetical protein
MQQITFRSGGLLLNQSIASSGNLRASKGRCGWSAVTRSVEFIAPRGGSAPPHGDRRCGAAPMREPGAAQRQFTKLERVPSATIGELKPAEIGSKSQTDP